MKRMSALHTNDVVDRYINGCMRALSTDSYFILVPSNTIIQNFEHSIIQYQIKLK